MSSSNSPTVKRSNSYRIALRKSGISKEYIDEFERMQLELAQQNAEKIISEIKADIPKILVNKQTIELSDNLDNKPKPKSFKRNFSNSKRNKTTATPVASKINGQEQLVISSDNDHNDNRITNQTGQQTTDIHATSVANLNNADHRNGNTDVVGNLMNNIAMTANDGVGNKATNNQDNYKNLQNNLNVKTTSTEKRMDEQNQDETSSCCHLLCLLFCCNYCFRSLNRS